MKIRVTKRAQKKYHSIVSRIKDEWGTIASNAFDQRTKDFFAILSDFPEIGVLEDHKRQLRAFQLTKITRVYYRIGKSEIVILYFFDVRQSPSKKPK